MILFGTGGIRGRMRVGEFDDSLVAQVSEAVSRWLTDEGGTTVVIAYDTRRNSEQFAHLAASVFSKNRLKVFVFDRPMPTPVLSFAVRYMEADAGVVITASHNPPEYNGYKVYTSNGVQALPDVTEKISQHLSQIGEVPALRGAKEQKPVPKEVQDAYEEAVMALMEEYGFGHKPRLAYSPLHGTGFGIVDTLLGKMGVDVHVVKEQSMWDGRFSTTPSPNPEDDEALSLLVKKMKEEGVSYGIATDPDTDRVGFVVMEQGQPKRLTGNQVGVLLADLSMKRRKLENPYVVKTIVTTDMVIPLCKEHNVEVCQTPTGFKYIGDLIHRREMEENRGFLFGFEESCGYLTGDFVKDKDGVIASCLLASLASYGDVLNRLEELYRKVGYYMERLINVSLTSVGVAKRLYDRLRERPPERVGSFRLSSFRDYSQNPGDVVPNETLLLETEAGRIFVRPSGTEPKLKLYIMVREETEQKARRLLNALDKTSRMLVDSLLNFVT